MNASEVRIALPELFKAKLSVFIKGPVGVGKSAIVRQVGADLGIEVRDTIRASQMDPTDVKGFPSPDAKKNLMRWLPPNFLPTDPNSRGILFLDELTSGAVAVQAALYQLMLDRRVGDYTLPDGWALCGAGNREVDRSIVNRMPAALANRMVHIDYEPDVRSFVAWAIDAGLSNATIGFIRFQENLLHDFQPQSSEAAFPSPRTWEMADKVMRMKVPGEIKLEILNGTLGRGAAAQYYAFASMMNDLPSKEQIAIDPMTAPIPVDNPGALYAITTSLGRATKTADDFRAFIQYMKRLDPMFQVVYVKDCLQTNAPIKNTSEWRDWSFANSDFLLN
jgi:hypothetical protein